MKHKLNIIEKSPLALGNKRLLTILLAAGICIQSFFSVPLNVHATEKVSGVIDYNAEAENRKSLPVTSNTRENWPAGPLIGAQSAILMDAETGAVLYEKNIHDKLYPASTTKILTALIAIEKSTLDETITYSNKAVTSINWREDSNMGIKPGEEISLEQSLYGLLVGSANEAGNAIGEHISGSIEEFVNLMNERAKELGCTDSNFVTTNGIFDENHYTSAHDMALIAKSFFANELLCKMSDTAAYTIPACSTVSQELVVHCKNKLLPGKQFAYDYLMGSKTGYTAESRQTLVSCAEKDGLKLVCVIMKEESPNQYQDTIDLFNYGFNNFRAVNVSETDTTYNIDGSSFFESDSNVFGSSNPILTIDPDSYIVLPNTVEFTDTVSELVYNETSQGPTATINYSYKDVFVGSAAVNVVSSETASVSDGIAPTESGSKAVDPENKSIYINIKYLILGVLAAAILITVIILIASFLRNYSFAKRRRAKLRRQQRRRRREVKLSSYRDDDYNL